MDLWIRNQDGDKITKVNSVNILAFENSINIHGYIDDKNHFWLGKYKSKERALEVLDEIQERITILNLMSTINGEKEMIKIAHAFGEDKINGVLKPYQMPKE